MTRRPAALMLATLLLAGCAGIDSGTVTDKRHIPAHCYTILMPNGKTTTPLQTCLPEKWQLDVTDGARSQWVDVTRAVYDATSIGDHWHK